MQVGMANRKCHISYVFGRKRFLVVETITAVLDVIPTNSSEALAVQATSISKVTDAYYIRTLQLHMNNSFTGPGT